MEKFSSILFLAAFILAGFIRFYDLNDKPLHTDEAVNALKFKSLLEQGTYTYDPKEYHGPSLYYLTLIPALIKSEHNIKETDEFTLRSVTAAASLLLIFFIYLARKQTGYKLALLAVLLTALSPIVTFYSRYYIHETLLVTFTYCGMISLFLYQSKLKLEWLLLAGLFFGLAFSTKETFIIAAGAIIISAVIVRLTRNKSEPKTPVYSLHWKYFTAVIIIVSILLFTAFFTNLRGIVDAFTTFEHYFTKAGINAGHIHPWNYYFSIVLFKFLDGVILSEIVFVLFAVVGIYYSFLPGDNSPNRKLMFFISLFTIIVTIAYSAIPYKTPWLMLTFWQGIIFLAAYGIMRAYRVILESIGRTILIVIIVLFFMHSATQIIWTSFRHSADPDNPYTYSHPQHDLVDAVEKINEICDSLDDGSNTYISVTAPRHEYWPLPWYLRKYSHVGWSDTVRHDIYRFPIILVTPGYEDSLVKYLYDVPPPGHRNLYIPLFDNMVELRPNLELRGYIRKELYDNYLNKTQHLSN